MTAVRQPPVSAPAASSSSALGPVLTPAPAPVPAQAAGLPAHQIPLPGSTFALWRSVVLRSAGMPLDWIDELADPALAELPADQAGFEAAYAAAITRQSAGLRRLAAEPLLREAVCWQVPRLVESVLDPLVHNDPGGRNSKWRLRERTAAAYAQRYCTKNDTIGFFGPVAWARWGDPGDPGGATTAHLGPELLAHRSVHFESWAVDRFADALLHTHGLHPHVAPRPAPTLWLDGDLLHRPYRPPRRLDPLDAAVLRACDGERTAAELAAELCWLGVPGLATQDEVFAVLRRLVADGLATWDLDVPLSSWPERALADRLRRVADPDLRDAALDELAELVAARDVLAATAGDPPAMRAAMAALDARFTRTTATAAFRRGGEHEAARTLVYTDTRRDVRLELDGALLTDLAPALDLVLRSARWFTAQVAARYRDELDALFDASTARTGQDWVPLSTLTFQLGPRLVASVESDKPTVELAAELRRRWSHILTTATRSDAAATSAATDVTSANTAMGPGAAATELSVAGATTGVPTSSGLTGGGRLRFTSAELADAVAVAFDRLDDGRPAAPAWAAARYHCPDIMLAADSVDAVVPGVTEVVLGELHVALNTADARSFIAQHPDPAAYTASIAADGLTSRVVPLLPKSWQSVSARTASPATPVEHYRYLSLGQDSGGSPTPSMPISALRVHRRDGRLVVTSLDGEDHGQHDIIEVLGELVSMVTTTEFGFLPTAARTPRVTVDRLVVQRETWRPAVSELALPHPRDESGEYRALRAWLTANGVPRRFFAVVPVEHKPIFVDALSPVLMQNLGRALRATERDRGPDATVAFSEMLPDVPDCWLRDAAGRRHTSELRMVAVDRGPA